MSKYEKWCESQAARFGTVCLGLLDIWPDEDIRQHARIAFHFARLAKQPSLEDSLEIKRRHSLVWRKRNPKPRKTRKAPAPKSPWKFRDTHKRKKRL